MKLSRFLATGLALALLATSAEAMGGRRRKKKKPAVEQVEDPMAAGAARLEAAEEATNQGKDELATRAYKKAAAYFQQATEASPEDPEAFNQLGFAHRKAGDYRKSLEAYSEALRLRPGYAEAIEYQAEAYMALHQYDKVMSAYMTLARSGDDEAASTLLTASKEHVAAREKEGADGSTFEAFADWVRRRDKLSRTMGRPGKTMHRPGSGAKKDKRW